MSQFFTRPVLRYAQKFATDTFQEAAQDFATSKIKEKTGVDVKTPPPKSLYGVVTTVTGTGVSRAFQGHFPNVQNNSQSVFNHDK